MPDEDRLPGPPSVRVLPTGGAYQLLRAPELGDDWVVRDSDGNDLAVTGEEYTAAEAIRWANGLLGDRLLRWSGEQPGVFTTRGYGDAGPVVAASAALLRDNPVDERERLAVADRFRYAQAWLFYAVVGVALAAGGLAVWVGWAPGLPGVPREAYAAALALFGALFLSAYVAELNQSQVLSMQRALARCRADRAHLRAVAVAAKKAAVQAK